MFRFSSSKYRSHGSAVILSTSLDLEGVGMKSPLTILLYQILRQLSFPDSDIVSLKKELGFSQVRYFSATLACVLKDCSRSLYIQFVLHPKRGFY